MRWCFKAVCGSEALAARGTFVQFLRNLGLGQSDCYCAEVVFGELVGNAVRHAPGPVHITAHVDGMLVLEVCDTGPHFELSVRPPHLHSERGRGLYIVSVLTSDLRSVNTGWGNRVTAILHMTEPVGKTS
jgi:anti-sigma regulatory factor (Ser/Thr protein kinase)